MAVRRYYRQMIEVSNFQGGTFVMCDDCFKAVRPKNGIRLAGIDGLVPPEEVCFNCKLLPEAKFDGDDYVPERDDPRLRGQILRVFSVMKDNKWRTLNEINALTGDPHASISAQLRHLRKEKFGAHTINKTHRGEPAVGLYEYQLLVNE